jgi:YggT family protein
MYAIIGLIDMLFQIFSFLILVEVIGSWILAARVNLPGWAYTILSAIHAVTAPILNPIRRLMPNMGGLDFSPIIALLLLQLLQGVVHNALLGAL